MVSRRVIGTLSGALAVVGAAAIAYMILSNRSIPITPDDHSAEGPPVVAMTEERIASSGIQLLAAGAGVLRQTLSLNGTLQPNQESVVQVTPRFPGVIREMLKRVGDAAQRNDLLARIESNQSLTVYDVRAPLPGTIIDRQGALGEFVGEQRAVFTIADLSTIWIDFSVRRQDLQHVRVGDSVAIDVGDGGPIIEAKISYVAPIGNSATQSAITRAVVVNEGLRLRPGLFVVGRKVVSEQSIDIAVPLSALQALDGRTVVFVRTGKGFEARQVEVGARDRDMAEIVFGLFEGDVYAASNSSLIRDELAKKATAHEH